MPGRLAATFSVSLEMRYWASCPSHNFLIFVEHTFGVGIKKSAVH